MNSDALPRTLHKLPRREDFIGRENYLSEIRHALLESKAWIVSIDGIGGVGKTSLALEAAHRVKDMGVYAAIVWVTAKASWLTPSGIESKRPSLSSEDDLIREIMSVAGIDDVAGGAEEKKVKALQLLSNPHRPYLIIIDNLDTVEDRRVTDFLSYLGEMASGNTKAIITSRRTFSTGERVIKVGGLEEDEAIALIRLEAEKKSVQSVLNASDTVLAEIARRCAGLPLAMKWIVGRITYTKASLSDTLKQLERTQGDVLRYIFGTILNEISPDARDVLFAVPAFVTIIPKPALEEITSSGSTRIRNALEELAQYCLLEPDLSIPNQLVGAEQYVALPATKMCIRASWEETPGLDAKYLDGATAYYQKYWKRFAQSMDAVQLDDHYQNVRFLLDWCFNTGQWKRVVELVTLIERYLRLRGLLDQRIMLCTLGIRAAQYEGDGRSVTRLRESIGKVYKQRGEYDEALAVFNEALTFYRDTGQTEKAAGALMQLGIILEHQALYSLTPLTEEARVSLLRAAYDRYNEAYTFFKESNDQDNQANISHLIGRVLRHLGDLERAEVMLIESLQIKGELGDPVRVAITQHELARLKAAQGDLHQATRLFEKSIAVLTEHGATKELANAKWGYSQLVRRDSIRIAEAMRLSIEAVEAYRLQGRWIKHELASRDLQELKDIAHDAEHAVNTDADVRNADEMDLDQSLRNVEDPASSKNIVEAINEITALLVQDPVIGADRLSSFLADQPGFMHYRADLEMKRSELYRLRREMDRHGGGAYIAEWGRAVRFLFQMCLDIEQEALMP